MVTISVIGAGYVGLVTAACFAQKGNKVILVENNSNKINMLLKGKIPFYEPGLDELVKQGLQNKNIMFVNTIKDAIAYQPVAIFSCVGTPPMPDGSADLSFVYHVAQEIGESITEYALVINKSTVPVGTAKKVKAIMSRELHNRGLSIPFDVASNPEFLKEGSALNDFLNPDRVIVGTQSEKAQSLLLALYKPFLSSPEQFMVMKPESAELTKYASNAMLATRISFMNQLSHLADKVGADIEQVKNGMAKDKRIGPHFLNAGLGYGGSCFPKDVTALIDMGNNYNLPMVLIKAVDLINKRQRQEFSNQVLNYYGADISRKKIGIWGLSFKPETDDTRCAPSLDIIKTLHERGCQIHVYDPVVNAQLGLEINSMVTFHTSAQDVLATTDALLILTEWSEFKNTEIKAFAQLQDKVIFDGRNCFDPYEMLNTGLTYFCIGRNALTKTIVPAWQEPSIQQPLASQNA